MSPLTSEARVRDPLRPVIGGTTPQPAPKNSVVAMPAVDRRTPWARYRPLAVLLGILGALNLAGLPYYLLATAQRVRHPLHPWLKPTGLVGQSAGVGAFALFLFLWLYPLRKKFRFLAFTGSIAKWLDVHVVAGLCIPLLAAMHAAWHFTGLIGLGYAAMMIVVLSGFIGRYLYVRIPQRSRDEPRGDRNGAQGSSQVRGQHRRPADRGGRADPGAPAGGEGTRQHARRAHPHGHG
jgi:hypothetical protein